MNDFPTKKVHAEHSQTHNLYIFHANEIGQLVLLHNKSNIII